MTTTIALYCTSQGHFYIRTLLKRYFNFFCYIKLTLSNTQRFFLKKKKFPGLGSQDPYKVIMA